MLVFSGDLEEIEEVGCSGMDTNGVLRGGWGWVGESCDFELVWALKEYVTYVIMGGR